ncbi:hypothetical protein DFP72DRAFT_919070 [Ephemerocybe angulata]|uniref:Uncharacterized protein n=1 Tax=Ephemerocybe angulata TaxID=980116 RepID=A0A8H6LYP3_9AGAR|nr:hypothetical protein DFP72DRAFT_919070 [Tulosesus angulatus]
MYCQSPCTTPNWRLNSSQAGVGFLPIKRQSTERAALCTLSSLRVASRASSLALPLAHNSGGTECWVAVGTDSWEEDRRDSREPRESRQAGCNRYLQETIFLSTPFRRPVLWGTSSSENIQQQTFGPQRRRERGSLGHSEACLNADKWHSRVVHLIFETDDPGMDRRDTGA